MNHDCITDRQGRLPCTCKFPAVHAETRPFRTCAELGVCQDRDPPCNDACRNPAIVPGGLKFAEMNTENSDDSCPHGDPWEFIDSIVIPLRWVALAASLAFTVLALAGFLSHN